MEDSIKNNKYFLGILMKGASFVLLVISIAVSVIIPFTANWFEAKGVIVLSTEQFFKITIINASIILLFAIILYCICSIKRFRDILLKENIIELNELMGKVKSNLRNSSRLADHIENCKIDIRNNIVEKSCLITSEKSFYDHLTYASKDNKNRIIRLTNFTKKLANDGESTYEDKKISSEYFNNELERYKNNPNAIIYKIVTIHTQDKLKELKALVKEAREKNVSNFNLAYLNIDKLDSHLPGIIGVQILDDEVILLNPRFARAISLADNHALYIKSSSIARIFERYHDDLWQEIKLKKRGFILIDIDNGGISDDDSIWDKIEKQIDEHINKSKDSNYETEETNKFERNFNNTKKRRSFYDLFFKK